MYACVNPPHWKEGGDWREGGHEREDVICRVLDKGIGGRESE